MQLKHIVLYTTHCPKCRVLEAKLKGAHIAYTTNEDLGTMQKLGIEQLPQLEIDGQLLGFPEAVKWVNAQT